MKISFFACCSSSSLHRSYCWLFQSPAALGPPLHTVLSCLSSAPSPYETCANPPAEGSQEGKTKQWDPQQVQLARPSSLPAWMLCSPYCFPLSSPWLVIRCPGLSRKWVEGSLALHWWPNIRKQVVWMFDSSGVLERSKWDCVEERCLSEMPIPTHNCSAIVLGGTDEIQEKIRWGGAALLLCVNFATLSLGST